MKVATVAQLDQTATKSATDLEDSVPASQMWFVVHVISAGLIISISPLAKVAKVRQLIMWCVLIYTI